MAPGIPLIASNNIASPSFRSRRFVHLLACVLVSAFTASCVWVDTSNLEDNFLDRPFHIGSDFYIRLALERELATRFPPGTRISKLVQDFESLGAICERTAVGNFRLCKYQQYTTFGKTEFLKTVLGKRNYVATFKIEETDDLVGDIEISVTSTTEYYD